MKFSVLLSLAILTLAVLISFAQSGAVKKDPPKESKDPQPTEPIVIKLDVLVVDNKKQVVDNLTADKFAVYENEVKQTVSSVEVRRGPLKFAVALDTSGSMRSVLPRIASAAHSMVDQMEGDDECQLIRFISSDKIQDLQPFTSDKIALHRAINSLYIEGGQSAVVDALYMTNQLFEKAESSAARRAIVVFSDGEDRNSFYKKDDLFKLMEKVKVPIYILKAGGGATIEEAKRGEKFLNRIALSSGGSVYPVNVDLDYVKAAASISLEMHAPYLLTYNSTNAALDGKTRNLKVEVNDPQITEKLIVFSRPRYTVPKQ